MITWAQFLSDTRSDLSDTGTNPRWSDDILYLYTKDGIRDYSTWFPKRVDDALITPTGVRYALPTDFLDVIEVECPLDVYLEKRMVRPGKTYLQTFKARYYYIQGGGIYLSAPTDEGLYLTYLATHDIPTGKDDSTFTFTVPDSDIELIRIFVKARVYGQMRAKQSALDRFKVGSGKRDDNPLQPEVEDLIAAYEAGIAKRIPGGIIMLNKIKRTRKWSALYEWDTRPFTP